jgi:hypothetical protein
MSDPVTNIDIEDVLTSIRRLVREGGGSTPSQSAESNAAGKPATPLADGRATQENPPAARFVLTAALRVAEPPTTFVPSANRNAPEALRGSAHETNILSGAGGLVEDRLDLGVADIVASDFVTEQPEAGTAPDEPERRLRVSDTAAGLEVSVTASSDDWEPDGSEGVPVMDWAQATPEDAPLFRSRQTGPMRRQLEAIVSEAEFVPEPTFRHGVSDTDKGPSTRQFPDSRDTAGADAGPGTSFREDFAAYTGKELVMEEAALRALIAEIVRQELQGSLGERITRNVRKLVRREISRMMTSEEFE